MKNLKLYQPYNFKSSKFLNACKVYCFSSTLLTNFSWFIFYFVDKRIFFFHAATNDLTSKLLSTANYSTSSRSNRAINARDSTIEEFPYTVSLEFDSNFRCGGSILSSNLIVTAAHCINKTHGPSYYQVRAGSSHVEKNGSVHWIRDYHLHNQLISNSSLLGYDLAVLRLENAIELDNKTKRSISLADGIQVVGSIATASGWGSLRNRMGPTPDHLMSVDLKIVDTKVCNDSWMRINESYFLLEGEICASDEIQSICFGDSGGPLVVNLTLVGITSLANNCTSTPIPNIFTDAVFFRNWIDQRIAESEQQVFNH